MSTNPAFPSPDNSPSSDLNALFERLYDDLRIIARRYMAGERPDHPLQSTALVHEAYMRLVNSGAKVENRAHFLRLASRTMRRILIEEARRRKAGGVRHTHITLYDEAGVVFPKVDMIDFDRALSRLEELNERQALVVELRFLIGLTVEEVATELDVSPRTIKGDTAFAVAWLRRELADH